MSLEGWIRMAKRRKYLYLSLIALAVGLCVYVIFKENSYLCTTTSHLIIKTIILKS